MSVYNVDRPLGSMRVNGGAPTTQPRSTSQEDITFWCNQHHARDNKKKICGWLAKMNKSLIYEQRDADNERVCAVFFEQPARQGRTNPIWKCHVVTADKKRGQGHMRAVFPEALSAFFGSQMGRPTLRFDVLPNSVPALKRLLANLPTDRFQITKIAGMDSWEVSAKEQPPVLNDTESDSDPGAPDTESDSDEDMPAAATKSEPPAPDSSDEDIFAPRPRRVAPPAENNPLEQEFLKNLISVHSNFVRRTGVHNHCVRANTGKGEKVGGALWPVWYIMLTEVDESRRNSILRAVMEDDKVTAALGNMSSANEGVLTQAFQREVLKYFKGQPFWVANFPRIDPQTIAIYAGLVENRNDERDQFCKAAYN